jgi:hypothetical protein
MPNNLNIGLIFKKKGKVLVWTGETGQIIEDIRARVVVDVPIFFIH